jgi:hypothetical protein
MAGLSGLTLPAVKVYLQIRNSAVADTSDFIRYSSAAGPIRQAGPKGGWFVDTDSNGNSILTPTIHYNDWLGIERYGSRISASLFLVSKAQPTGDETLCPGDPANQYKTPAPDLQNCLSYVTDTLQISGNGQMRDQAVQMLIPPTVTSRSYVDFTAGVFKTFGITLSSPMNSVPCSLSRSSGQLPGGVTFTPATKTFSGTPSAASTGLYRKFLLCNAVVRPSQHTIPRCSLVAVHWLSPLPLVLRSINSSAITFRLPPRAFQRRN